MIGPVLLLRPDGNQRDAAALAAVGVASESEPWLTVTATLSAAGVALRQRLAEADERTWLVVTSPRTWRCWAAAGATELDDALRAGLARGLHVASVGPATTATLPCPVSLEPADSSATGLLAALPPSGVALLPGSARRSPELGSGLAGRGWTLHAADVYDTRPAAAPPATAARLSRGDFAGVLLRSPSAVQAVAAHATVPVTTVMCAVGPSTSAAARRRPWRVAGIPVGPVDDVARACRAALEGTPA